MERRIQIIVYLFCCWTGICFHGNAQIDSGSVAINFVATVGDSLAKRDYWHTNHRGEKFTIRNFRFYVSGLHLLDSAGRPLQAPNDYSYLIDVMDTAGRVIRFPSLNSSARFIRFLVGVDSLKNVTGVHTGELDPAKGMYWTWNSGYVMAKLEGKSTVSRAPGNYYTYHVGGYKPGESAARWVTLVLPPKPWHTWTIEADVLRWFKGVHDISIASHPVCHEPGDLAMMLADNYAAMFNILNH